MKFDGSSAALIAWSADHEAGFWVASKARPVRRGTSPVIQGVIVAVGIAAMERVDSICTLGS